MRPGPDFDAATRDQPQLRVGTSGWIYKEWAGVFYPEEMPKRGELEHYATQFNTVEINATFYRLPLLSSTRGWHRRTPNSFVFAVKGSRFITHLKRLRVTALSLRKFFERIRPLGRKCGPILWQLPPNFAFESKRLEIFLKKLPATRRHAVEFRHPSWYETPETFSLLAAYKAAHVAVSSLRMPMNFQVTTDFAYLRFHGLAGGPRHDYSQSELEPWARHAAECLQRRCTVYAYFNNDLNTRAPWNAKMFKELVQRKTSDFAPGGWPSRRSHSLQSATSWGARPREMHGRPGVSRRKTRSTFSRP
jgi:uncharacterized protein YecE (DUF72 family)